jgi:hypothetical protein
MINEQHKYAMSISNPLPKADYKKYMCGACAAIGENFGLVSRVLTSYDITLLNILLASQANLDLDNHILIKRCPTSLKKVETISYLPDFTASVAIVLGYLSALDQINDNKGFNFMAQASKLLLNKKFTKAINNLEKKGISRNLFESISMEQLRIELDNKSDASSLTSHLCALLFESTSTLTSASENEKYMHEIGKAYGKYIYLFDTYMDFPKDYLSKSFNFLRSFSYEEDNFFLLSIEGLQWIQTNLSEIIGDIRINFEHVTLKRNKEMIYHLLLDPVEKLRQSITKTIAEDQCLCFKRWQPLDAIKVSMFIMPLITFPVVNQFLGNPLSPSIVENANKEINSILHNINQTGYILNLNDIMNDVSWVNQLIYAQADEIGPCGQGCGLACNSDDGICLQPIAFCGMECLGPVDQSKTQWGEVCQRLF